MKGFSAIIVAILAALILLVGAVVFSIPTKKGPSTSSNSEKASQSQKRNFVALGASFTKANNLSSSLSGDNPEYSFATGTKIESIYLSLKNKGENIESRNLAESGANSQKVLSQQVLNAVSFQPKYVVIDIMADIFEEERPASLRENLKQIVKQIKNSENVVLVSTYPNLVSMRKAQFPSCSQDKLGLGVDKVTEDKLRLFNQTIADIAKEFDLILVDNFNTLGPNEVSDYDCLHPNIEGQKKLAKSWITALEKGR